jgi:lipoprotein-anchoring transpeptidase ErfK/SrfK
VRHHPKYQLPGPSKASKSAFLWICILVVAAVLAWIWWQAAHSAGTAPKPVTNLPIAQPPRNQAQFQPAPIGGNDSSRIIHPAAPPQAAPAPVAESTAKPPVSPTQELQTHAAPGTNAVSTNIFPREVLSVFEAQLALARQGISPGSLDGASGPQTSSALRAFQRKEHLPETGQLDPATRERLLLANPPCATYIVTSNDLARLQPLSPTWLGKSQQTALDYETILELVSEKSHAHPNLVRRLNPTVAWTNVSDGTSLILPDAPYAESGARAAFVTIRLADKTLEAFDANTNLLVHFPCSIARLVEKRPVGELHVQIIVPDPNYTFDPALFPESPEARELNRKLILPPGPNNPVGVAWIGLDKPGYGIHGTPSPEQIGRTESHGCFRLANWNAAYLLKLVWIGTPVHVEP